MDDVSSVRELHGVSAIIVAAASLAQLLQILHYVIAWKIYGYLT